jgi:hypothetical protein
MLTQLFGIIRQVFEVGSGSLNKNVRKGLFAAP